MKNLKKFHESLIEFMGKEEIISPRVADIMKMRLLEEKEFRVISDVFDLSEARVRQLFNHGLSVVENFSGFFQKVGNSLEDAKEMIREKEKELHSLRNTVIRELLGRIDFLEMENQKLKKTLKVQEGFEVDTFFWVKRVASRLDEEIFQEDIEFLHLPKNTEKALRDARIYTIGDIVDLGEKNLSLVHRIGESGMEKIKQALKEKGLSLE